MIAAGKGVAAAAVRVEVLEIDPRTDAAEDNAVEGPMGRIPRDVLTGRVLGERAPGLKDQNLMAVVDDAAVMAAPDHHSPSRDSVECPALAAAPTDSAGRVVNGMITKIAMDVPVAAGRCGPKPDSIVAAANGANMVPAGRVVPDLRGPRPMMGFGDGSGRDGRRGRPDRDGWRGGPRDFGRGASLRRFPRTAPRPSWPW